MLITCPHCHFEMRAKAHLPGRFKAACLSCGRKMRITIRHAEASQERNQVEESENRLGLISGGEPNSTGSWAALPLGSDPELPTHSKSQNREDPSNTLVWGMETLEPEDLAANSGFIDIDEESVSTSSWSVEALGSPDAPSLSESDDSIATDFWDHQGQGKHQHPRSSDGDTPRAF